MVLQDACSGLDILLVDDEISFRTSLAEMLRDDGHAVRDYGAPAQVPELGSLCDVALLVTDYEMPGRNGVELADEFHACHPDVPILLLTAYCSEVLEANVAARSFVRLVQKPIDYGALHALIHAAAKTGSARG
jgi:two-component system nitrogen regulation response regulator GlnG